MIASKHSKRVVVTGGSGFMGSHVADELSKRGHDVVIFDLVPSPWLRIDQAMVIGGVDDRDKLSSALKGADAVFHFAGVADIQQADVCPMTTLHANVLGTANVLECMSENKVPEFFQASSVYVYSEFGGFYRASKQAAEIIIEAYSARHQFNFQFLRYGSLYGERAQSWNGLNKFVEQIMEAGVFKYMGTGQEVREYIHVLDAARLSVDIFERGADNASVIITGQQTMRIDEIASLIFEIAGKPKVVEYQDREERMHYGVTPYRYVPKSATKMVPSSFVDIGQGILNLLQLRDAEGEDLQDT